MYFKHSISWNEFASAFGLRFVLLIYFSHGKFIIIMYYLSLFHINEWKLVKFQNSNKKRTIPNSVVSEYSFPNQQFLNRDIVSGNWQHWEMTQMTVHGSAPPGECGHEQHQPLTVVSLWSCVVKLWNMLLINVLRVRLHVSLIKARLEW